MTDRDFRNAFYTHKDVLYRFVYRMTGSANGAEDIVQECFLALWRKPEAYDPYRGALRAFLIGIARKLVLKRWRDEHPSDSLEEDSSICGPVDFLGRERAEIVSLRATVTGLLKKPPLEKISRGGPAPSSSARRGSRDVFFDDRKTKTPAYARTELKAGNRIAGPALVEEHASTTVLLPGDRMKVDGFGNLVIEVGKR